ncbi:hypothetical protein FLK63_20390 [Burkholderia gladioli]|nr:hypothetical protein [Burkholderia gladioli]
MNMPTHITANGQAGGCAATGGGPEAAPAPAAPGVPSAGTPAGRLASSLIRRLRGCRPSRWWTGPGAARPARRRPPRS